MIPLGAGEIPTSGSECAARVAAAVGLLVKATGGVLPRVDCEMESPENISRLNVDLTNIEAVGSRAEKPTTMTALGRVKMGEMTIGGDPVRTYGAPVTLKIEGKNLPMAWARDDRGSLWLIPSDERGTEGNASGEFELAAPVDQIEVAARTVIGQLAEANGAKLKDVRIKLESSGPRSLSVRAEIAAAKFMMTAKVHATGTVSLDNEMNLRIEDLNVSGDGAAGSMVANMLGDKLSAFRGRKFPLAQYMFAGATLTDVQLQVTDRVCIAARFGKKSAGEIG